MWISKRNFETLNKRMDNLEERIRELGHEIAVGQYEGSLHASVARHEVPINQVVAKIAEHLGMVRKPGTPPSLEIIKKR